MRNGTARAVQLLEMLQPESLDYNRFDAEENYSPKELAIKKSVRDNIVFLHFLCPLNNHNYVLFVWSPYWAVAKIESTQIGQRNDGEDIETRT